MAKKKVKKAKALTMYEKIEAELKGFELKVIDSGVEDIEHNYVPFRNTAMNIITGGGAIEDKFTEISGDSQTGKSYLLYELMANVLNNGGHAYLNDNELAYERAYGKRAGILAGKKYMLSEEKDIQRVFGEMRAYIRAVRKYDKNNLIICGIDSFVGLSTKVDLANEEANKDPRGYMAMQKNLAFQNAIANFVKWLDKYNVILILVNQAKLDRENSGPYHKAYKSLGEDVIKFWCTQRIRLLNRGKVKKLVAKEGKKKKYKIIGQSVYVEVIKNRTTPPFQSTTIQMLFEKGIIPLSGLQEILTKESVIVEKKVVHEGSQIKAIKHIASGKLFKNIEKLVEKFPEVAVPSNYFSLKELDSIIYDFGSSSRIY